MNVLTATAALKVFEPQPECSCPIHDAADFGGYPDWEMIPPKPEPPQKPQGPSICVKLLLLAGAIFVAGVIGAMLAGCACDLRIGTPGHHPQPELRR